MSLLPDPIKHRAYRLAYLLLRGYSGLFRPHTRGVKCLLTCGEKLLLVRHSYGPAAWDLPGGFCRRGETFVDAARRELGEELGVTEAVWTDLGELRRRFQGRHETLHCFRAELPRAEVSIGSAEVAEARWFPRDALPERIAPIVRGVAALDDRSGAGLPPSGQG